MRVYASGASVRLLCHSGSPLHGSEPLADESGDTNTLSGLFELFVMLYTYMRALCVLGQLPSPSVSSGHDLVLPVSESGGFGSAGPVLARLCVSPAVFACSATPCVAVRVFGVLVRLMALSRPFLGRFSGLPGK